jgi:hypothetical protein
MQIGTRRSAAISASVSAGAGLALADHPMAALVVIGVQTSLLGGPVLVATLVLSWHVFKGTNPGPAGRLLLELIRIEAGPP